jgi:hypothetical protein
MEDKVSDDEGNGNGNGKTGGVLVSLHAIDGEKVEGQPIETKEIPEALLPQLVEKDTELAAALIDLAKKDLVLAEAEAQHKAAREIALVLNRGMLDLMASAARVAGIDPDSKTQRWSLNFKKKKFLRME